MIESLLRSDPLLGVVNEDLLQQVEKQVVELMLARYCFLPVISLCSSRALGLLNVPREA